MSHIVNDVMTAHPHTVFVGDTLQSAYRKLKQYKIRHLPVVNGEAKLVGILSERDFQRIMVREKIDRENEAYSFDLRDTIEEVMSWPVQAIGETTSIKTAARIMLQNKLSALVITSRENRPVGIVTTDDLLSYLIERETSDLERPLAVVLSRS